MTERSQPILELQRVSKQFGSLKVLKEINLWVAGGEVLALVGDNGAGKSTLLKIMSGYLSPNSGIVKVLGQPISFTSPQDAREAGIETVYQDLAIVDGLNLWRNFFLGRELRRPNMGIPVLNRQEMKTICEGQLRQFGLVNIRSADQLAGMLSGGERQSLAIARAVYFKSQLLLLDEPVAALSIRERRRVFETIERAKRQGVGILYIDHNMHHVLPMADRIAVMQHGSIGTVIGRGEKSVEELNELVAGDDLS